MGTIYFKNVTKNYKVPDKTQTKLQSFTHPKYTTLKAVNDVSFEVKEGQIFGLVGENGAGKTTILKMASGILDNDEGTILVNQQDPFHKDIATKRKIAFIFGNKTQLWWDLPAMESFEITKKLYNVKDTEYKKNLEELCSVLKIDSFIHQPIRSLSLGQRMRCELTNSLLYHPDILFLDEPTLGLDLTSQILMRSYIQHYVQENHVACIVTSHYMKDITGLTSDMTILHKGTQMYSGKTKEFINICSKHTIIEVEGIFEIIKEKFKEEKVYMHDSSIRMFVEKDRVTSLVNQLLQCSDITSFKIIESDIEDLIENGILLFQGESSL